MEVFTIVEATYFILLLNLENKSALKTASEFFGKNIRVKMYKIIFICY